MEDAHLSVFLSSPIKPSLTPESLKRALPRDADAHFWTAEKGLLTPKTVKAIARQHPERRVMAHVSHVLQKDSPTKTNPTNQALQMTIAMKGDESKYAERSLLEQILLELAEIRAEKGRTDKELAEIRAGKVQTDKELAEIRAEKGRTDEELAEIRAEKGRTDKELAEIRAEMEIYTPLSSTRYLTTVSLMATLLNVLNHYFLKVLIRDSTWQSWVGEKLPFPLVEDVSYFKAWWYHYHEVLEQEAVPLQDFWKKELGYTGLNVSSNSKKRRRVGSHASRAVAKSVGIVMGIAEHEFIMDVADNSITCEALRTAVGFYISLIRSDRNFGIHLIQNLFTMELLPGEAPAHSSNSKNATKDPFKTVNRSFVVNEQLRANGVIVLNDIVSNLDKIGDLISIQHVVGWFAGWLLKLCSKEGEKEEKGKEESNRAEDSAQEVIYHNGVPWYRAEGKWIWWCEEQKTWLLWEESH